MRTLTLLLLGLMLSGCATTAPRDAAVRAVAVETFGNDANLKIHEVMYVGPLSSALASLGTSYELELADSMQPGATHALDLAVWSYSSSKAASVLIRALRYPGVQRLPHLRLLFVGEKKDADRVRSAVEATGAKFFWHER